MSENGDKKKLYFTKLTSVKNDDYIHWIKSLKCIVTQSSATDWMAIDPHHVNDKTGGSAKFNDYRAIPLRHDLHVELHNIGTKTFQKKYNVDFEVIIEALNRLYDKAY